MRKFFKVTHKWLALPAGLIISIVCFTGSILVFKTELLELMYPSRYFVEEVNQQALPLHELIPMVNSQLEDGVEINSVQITADKQRTYSMSLNKGFRVSAYVDPYTGQLVGKYDPKEDFFWDVMLLHRWLMDGSRTWGKYSVGVSTAFMAILLISGLVLWYPRKKKKGRWKNSLTIATSAGRKRLLYDLHNVLGAYASIILLVCSLTGLMWSFDWYRNTVFQLFGAEAPNQEKENKSSVRKTDKFEKQELNIAYWQDVYSQVAKENPNNEYISVRSGSASVHHKGEFRSRQQDKYVFDDHTGVVSEVVPYNQQAKTIQLWGWIYSLHVGDYWGIWSKVLTCLASIIGGSLPLTGYYLYFAKKRRKKKRGKKGHAKKEIKSISLQSNVESTI